MKTMFVPRIAAITAIGLFCGVGACAAEGRGRGEIERVVDAAIRPVRQAHGIPGVAVAVTVRGQRHFFNYGVASKQGGQQVTEQTIFEIGSISKTFTATLAAYAQATWALSFSDSASKYLQALAGSRFDDITLLDLGTYTAGGLPLQFPDDVSDRAKMIAYYRSWRPTYAAGTHRLYSNPSIGLFGELAAASMGEPFDDAMEGKLFPLLGLSRTYLRVPEEQMRNYAWGYAGDDKPVRVSPGMLDAQAYGVKTTATDMIRFVEANMFGAGLDATLQRAIATTHTGYFRVGDLVQGLGWEMVAYPTCLDGLLAANSAAMAFEARAATRLAPPRPPQRDVLIDKTGSTNGFGAYVMFVPAEGVGIVMLADKNYPIPDRVKAAHRILETLVARHRRTRPTIPA